MSEAMLVDKRQQALVARRLQPSATDRAFRTVVAEAGQDVRALVDLLTAGELSPAEWHDQMLATLAEAHAEAGYRGRVRAGDTAPYDRDDQRFGWLVAQEEARYLDGFRRALEAGRYESEAGTNEAAILRRANLYVQRLYGTANEALALVAEGERWHWERGKEDSCRSCIRLEENSPYIGLPPTLPRMGKTECLNACGCRCFTDSGLETFVP